MHNVHGLMMIISSSFCSNKISFKTIANKLTNYHKYYFVLIIRVKTMERFKI